MYHVKTVLNNIKAFAELLDTDNLSTTLLYKRKSLVKTRLFTAADGNRTRDLRTTNATHYRLCYTSL